MKYKILNAIQEGIKQSFMIDGSELEDENFVKSKISKTEDFVPYEYRIVDLGLSVKWAEYNLGAYPSNDPKSWYGNYYAWGELESKTKFSQGTYQFKESLTKYNEKDNLKQLQPEDDIATQKLGDMYRMPTKAEFEELYKSSKVTNEYVKNYKGISGLNGRLFTSKVPGFEGVTLFIPAAGYFNGSKRCSAGSNGYVWSSSLYPFDPDYAYTLGFFSSDIYPSSNGNRCYGLSVRSVQNSSSSN